MTDRELLKRAAKAAGIELRWQEYFAQSTESNDGFWFTPKPGPHNRRSTDGGEVWNPLIDDGDALRLAVKLNLSIFPNDYPEAEKPYAMVEASDPGQRPTHASEFHAGDPYAAVRRAVVRAAAALAEDAL